MTLDEQKIQKFDTKRVVHFLEDESGSLSLNQTPASWQSYRCRYVTVPNYNRHPNVLFTYMT